MSLIITLLIFEFIILVHEWGHFIVAKKSGVFVEEFAIGMGFKLFGKEKNGTLYTLRLFPLGGYCKMKDEDVSGDDPDSFSNATIFKKLAIVFAGAFMNFVLALSIFAGIALFSGNATTEIAKVSDNFPAKEAGLQQGDIIYKINGSRVHSFQDISFRISRIKKGEAIDLVVIRDNQKLNFKLYPKFDENSNKALIGINPTLKNGAFAKDIKGIEKSSFIQNISDGFWNMIFTVKVTIIGLFDLITGQMSIKDMTGPIGLAPVIDKEYDTAMQVSIGATILTMLNIMALLSANIGVFNLLPIPALDGGRILFLLVELVRGKPIPPEKEGNIHFIGFVLIMALGIFIAFKDIFSLF